MSKCLSPFLRRGGCSGQLVETCTAAEGISLVLPSLLGFGIMILFIGTSMLCICLGFAFIEEFNTTSFTHNQFVVCVYDFCMVFNQSVRYFYSIRAFEDIKTIHIVCWDYKHGTCCHCVTCIWPTSLEMYNLSNLNTNHSDSSKTLHTN